MTEELRHLLRTEAAALDVPPPPTDALRARGLRIRRRRQALTTAAVAACVLAAVAGGITVARLGDGPSSSPARPVPTVQVPDPTPDPTPTGRLEVSGTGISQQPFGTPRDQVVPAVTDALGEPDVTVGPLTFFRLPGESGYFETEDDNLSPRWPYRVLSVSCWNTLCLIFGGQSASDLGLRGWELAEFRRFAAEEDAVPEPHPDVTLAGTDVGIGSPWADLHAAFPKTKPSGGEGASQGVTDLPWNAIFDGVGEWRMSGYHDFDNPDRVPPGSVVTRLSGGEGPEPGCC